jgi:hypothetical protein
MEQGIGLIENFVADSVELKPPDEADVDSMAGGQVEQAPAEEDEQKRREQAAEIPDRYHELMSGFLSEMLTSFGLVSDQVDELRERLLHVEENQDSEQLLSQFLVQGMTLMTEHFESEPRYYEFLQNLSIEKPFLRLVWDYLETAGEVHLEGQQTGEEKYIPSFAERVPQIFRHACVMADKPGVFMEALDAAIG